MIENYKTDLQYLPLTLFNPNPAKTTETDFELREHIGGSCVKRDSVWKEEPIPDKSLINFARDKRPKLAICITQYNEPLFQLIESLAGIYRAYYELGKN